MLLPGIGQANPVNSESDIQKRLRYLLPKDYATEHRRFRPRNEKNMRLRFTTLKVCERRFCHRNMFERSRWAGAAGSLSKVSLSVGQEDYSALRGYGTCSTYGFLSEESSLPSEALLGSSTHETTSLASLELPPLPKSPLSQLVEPSQVMLDGSILEHSSKDETLSRERRLEKPVPKAKLPGAKQPYGKVALSRDSKPSIGSMRAGRTGAHTPSVYAEHVSSVLQYSSSSSSRSSFVSLTSLSISRNSPRSVANSERNLTGEEQSIWDELIDESKISSWMSTACTSSADSGVFIMKHKCCASFPVTIGQAFPSCGSCGFTGAHRLLADKSTASISSLEIRSLHKVDYFGNTPLHCAAASGNIGRLQDLVRHLNPKSLKGSDLIENYLNTSGESFLHLLRCKTLEDLQLCCSLLGSLCNTRKIVDLFSLRDYHGRTILHRILQNQPDEGFEAITHCTVTSVQRILEITEIPIDSRDNQGKNIREILEDRVDELKLPLRIDLLSPTTRYQRHSILTTISALRGSQTSVNPPSSFRLCLSDSSACFSCTQQRQAISDMLEAGLDINWIDRDGDTPLTAIIKNWLDDENELQVKDFVSQLLFKKANVHMRDRSGNTALCSASRRGFRAVVKILLEAGANVHSRDNHGVGILSQIAGWMNSAKRDGNDVWHARIWSCAVLLVDHGAKPKSTVTDEWMTPYGKERIARRATTTRIAATSSPQTTDEQLSQRLENESAAIFQLQETSSFFGFSA
jgi:ankyrin repeat protein